MADINGGTLYEWNQIQVNNIEPMEEPMITRRLANIGAWFSSQLGYSYYMFLNNELHDYTIFNFMSYNYDKAVSELRELIESRGEIISIDFNHEEEYFEVWIRCQDDISRMYLFFPCDGFVIEI